MTEQHEIYRVTSPEVAGLLNELNQIFNLLASRLDKMEGLRGTPSFYSDEFAYPNQVISGAFQAKTTGVAAFFEDLAWSDFGFENITVADGTLSITDDSDRTKVSVQDTFVKVYDENSVVIHQFGGG